MGWEVSTLGSLGKVSMCKRILKKETKSVGDIPFYKIGTFGKAANAFIDNDIYEEYKSKYSFPKKGDILISASGTIGRRVIYDGRPAYFQDSNIVWIDNDEKLVLNEYLYHFYALCDWNPSKGATISRLYNDDLRCIKIPYPSLEEQKKIVAILDQAFAEIDKARANAEQNLNNARELFDSYLNQVFSQRGEGWEEKKLGDICIFENGDRGKNYPSRAKFVNSGVAFINAGHIDNGIVDFNNMNYITEENYDLLSRGKVKKGDLLFCLRGSLGKFAIYEEDFNAAIASSLVIVKPQLELTSYFLGYYFRSNLCREMIMKYAGGAAQPNLGAKDLAKFIIALPAVERQQVLTENLDRVWRSVEYLMDLNLRKLELLEELKKSILQKAFSGELT